MATDWLVLFLGDSPVWRWGFGTYDVPCMARPQYHLKWMCTVGKWHMNEVNKTMSVTCVTPMAKHRLDDFLISSNCTKAVRYWSCPLSRNQDRIIPGRPHMPKQAQTCKKKACPWWDSNPRLQDLGADTLPTETWFLMISHSIIAECCPSAAMRFTANKNVALSVSTITA